MDFNGPSSKRKCPEDTIIPDEILMSIKTEPEIMIEQPEPVQKYRLNIPLISNAAEFKPQVGKTCALKKNVMDFNGWVETKYYSLERQYRKAKPKKEQQENILSNLLKSWDLKHIASFFKDENITLKILTIMTYKDIFEITPHLKIGDRILFKHCLIKWRADNNIPLFSTKKISEFQDSFPHTIETAGGEYDLKTILMQQKIGCQILEYYEKNHRLTEEYRSCLINIIVQYFESRDLQMSLAISYQVENQILKIFPNESLEYYRTERRGKIYTMYCNRKKLQKAFKDSESVCSTTSAEDNFDAATCEKKIDALRDLMEQNLYQIQSQINVLLEAQIEQNLLLRGFVASQENVNNKFPLKSEEELKELNDEITPENRESYINTIKALLNPQGIKKNLKYILSNDVMSDYNIDGVHGKKSLKDAANFYDVLIDSIEVTGTSGAADQQLREAIRLAKKRYFKTKCLARPRATNDSENLQL